MSKNTTTNGFRKKRFVVFSLDDENPNLPYLLILPCMLVIFVVFLYPIMYSAVMSASNVDLSSGKWTFVGFKNFISLGTDKYFLEAIGRTILFTAVTVIFEIIIGTLMALLLNQDFKGRGFVRGVMILPWALPTVVNAIMWKWIFNANYGVFNALMKYFHLIDNYHVWLGVDLSAFICVVVANIWKETPYVVLLVLAALANIPKELYEAARMDGCGSVKSFLHITIASIRPTLIILAVTKTIWAIQTFDLVYIMTAGGPGKATELITYYIYRNTFKFLKFGYGAAMSYALMIVTLFLSYLYIKALSKNNEIV